MPNKSRHSHPILLPNQVHPSREWLLSLHNSPRRAGHVADEAGGAPLPLPNVLSGGVRSTRDEVTTLPDTPPPPLSDVCSGTFALGHKPLNLLARACAAAQAAAAAAAPPVEGDAPGLGLDGAEAMVVFEHYSPAHQTNSRKDMRPPYLHWIAPPRERQREGEAGTMRRAAAAAAAAASPEEGDKPVDEVAHRGAGHE